MTSPVRTQVDERTAAIDAPRVADNPELTRWIQKVSQAINANLGTSAPATERVVRMADLFNLGVVEVRGADGNFVRGSGPPPKDLRWSGGTATDAAEGVVGPPGPAGPPGIPYEPPVYSPPTVPTNLQASASLTSIILTWDAQDFDVVAYVEVWASGTNNLATAALIGSAFTNLYVDAVGATNVLKYYWIRSVGFDPDDPPSAYNSSVGVAAQTGKIAGSDLQDLIITASKLADGAVTGGKIADLAISAAKFAGGIAPVGVYTNLPNPVGYTGPSVIYVTSDGKLYRYVGGAWVKEVPWGDVTGVAVTSTQITDGAITTPKLAAGSVTANELAANSIIAGKIAAGAVTATAIAANAIAVGTAAIQNGAIVNAMIGTAAIDDAKIASLDAGKITTGFLNAARIQTGSIDSRIAQITDAQIQSLSAGKIVSTYLSSINANLGQVTAGTIDMNSGGAWSSGWSYIRSPGKWLDSNNGFVAAGYQPDGSYFFDVKAGNNQIRLHTGPSSGGTNALINFGNGNFYVDSAGSVTAWNIFARGNVEATTLNAGAANIVNTIHLAGNAVIVPASNTSTVLYQGSTFAPAWQTILTCSITLQEYTKLFITANVNIWLQTVSNFWGDLDWPPYWAVRLLGHNSEVIWSGGPAVGNTGWESRTFQPMVTIGAQWAENAGTRNFYLQFWGHDYVAAYGSSMMILGTRKST